MCSILKKLGEGASAKVFLLQVKRNKKKYALKIINTGSQDEADTAMSEREASLLLRLNHPQVISCLDAFQKGPHLLLLTEYCSLGDLAQHIAARSAAQPPCHIEQTQAVQWIDNLAQALAYLHQQKILHRDLKPSNIFIAEDSSLKIGDLGIAKEFERTIAKASTFIGTLLYMSPEIFSWQQYSYGSDIWSLGCCLHEMLALAYPFWAESRQNIFRKIRNADYGELPDCYTAPLHHLVKSMLQRDPSLRPTASDVVMQLQPLKVTPGVKVRARKRRYLKAKAAEAAAKQAGEDGGSEDAGAISRYDIFQGVVLYYKQGWEESELSVDDLEMLTNISSSSGSSDSRTIVSQRAGNCEVDGGADDDSATLNSVSSRQQSQPKSAISESPASHAPEASGDVPDSLPLLTSSEQSTLVSSSSTQSSLLASAEQTTLTAPMDVRNSSKRNESNLSRTEDEILGLQAELNPLDNVNNNAPVTAKTSCPILESLSMTSDSPATQNGLSKQTSVSEVAHGVQPKHKSKCKVKTSPKKSSHKTSHKASVNDRHAQESDFLGENGEKNEGVEDGKGGQEMEETSGVETFQVDAREVMDWVRSRLESSTRFLPGEELPSLPEDSPSPAQCPAEKQWESGQGADSSEPIQNVTGEDKRKKKKRSFLAERRKKNQQAASEEVRASQDEDRLPVPKPRTRNLSPTPPPPPTPPPRVKATVDEVTGEKVICPVRLYTRSQQVTYVNIKSPACTEEEGKPGDGEEKLLGSDEGKEGEDRDAGQGRDSGNGEKKWLLKLNGEGSGDGQMAQRNEEDDELERAMHAELGETTLTTIVLLMRMVTNERQLQAQLRDLIGWRACERYDSILSSWMADRK